MKTQQPKYHVDPSFWRPFLEAGLAEDQGIWDWSTRAVFDQNLKAQLIAKDHGIWVGTGLVQWLPEQAHQQGLKFKSTCKLREGDAFKPQQILATFSGPANLILGFERPVINLVAFASGIATRTQALVSIVEKTAKNRKIKNPPRITGTRKTLPHYRDLSIHAIMAGGGFPHRTSLSSGVLLKENHIAAAGSIAKSIEKARKNSPHTLKIEIEVRDLKELRQACDAKADIVMLDNFSPPEVQSALKQISKGNHSPLIEVSGGMNENNIGDYTLNGVDIISVGGLSHSVKSCDLSWLVI